MACSDRPSQKAELDTRIARSGFAVSATQLAMPDAGLISYAEMLTVGKNICDAAWPYSRIPMYFVFGFYVLFCGSKFNRGSDMSGFFIGT